MRATRAARADHQKTLQSIARKQEIVADLVAGRLALLEATARFRQAGGAGPRAAEWSEPADESWCRTLIGWAQLALSDRPERAEAVSASLEQELQLHLTQHGTLSLPA